MFLSSKKSYLLLVLISFVQLTAMQPGIKKRSLRNMMKKHHKILKKGSKLSINHLPQKIRHELLTTTYRLDHPMFPVYLNDWVIKECAMPAYIVDMIGREITIIDIEKHLAKTKKFRFPHALYKEIGRKIAWLYIIPHIKNQAKNMIQNIIRKL
ncbi:unnamed protein product [marine sediment metagenome]|uniref:Uncharacterized protein n=1 Tax=marine sediment metagenome TaxID=412755 RepID=X1TE17_9ZZZZ